MVDRFSLCKLRLSFKLQVCQVLSRENQEVIGILNKLMLKSLSLFGVAS